MDVDLAERICGHLIGLYGEQQGRASATQLEQRLADFSARHPALQRVAPPAERLTENDVMLITYGDQVREPGRPPLQTLADVLNTTFRGVVNTVHILPFYPYSSDDGFSVIDYRAVDPQLGSWDDLAALRSSYQLMFDAVVNHISAGSAPFQAFLRGEPGAEAQFMLTDPATDLAGVTRPRTTPLLTPFQTPSGTHYVWTTFSADQIDLNFRNPAVLLEIIDVLLLYVAQGATLIRLDAIGYLWKEIGTRCIHLPQTHRAVQLFRSVLDAVAPGVALITETNVPHADNISYFGDGTNEAQLVYQFPLPPLVLNALHRGSAQHLTAWASQLAPPVAGTAFFNFLASHDGIGVVPASGILSQAEVAALVARTEAHGGQVSFKSNPDGTESAYELNITLFDALSDPAATDDRYAIDRFIAAHAIMLALQGVPGIYVHSLIGSHNYLAGVAETGRARTINREKWTRADLEQRLGAGRGHAKQVYQRLAGLVGRRRAERAFHPAGPQQVIAAGEQVFTLLRRAPDGRVAVLCIHNVSDQPQALRLDTVELGLPAGTPLSDLAGGDNHYVNATGTLELRLAPYQVAWLRATL